MPNLGCKSTKTDDPFPIQYCKDCGCNLDFISCRSYLREWEREIFYKEV